MKERIKKGLEKNTVLAMFFCATITFMLVLIAIMFVSWCVTPFGLRALFILGIIDSAILYAAYKEGEGL